MIWTFVVDLEPVAQPRLTQTWTKTGKRVAYVAGIKDGRHPVEGFKKIAAGRAVESRPAGWRLEGPMTLRLEFVFPGKAPVRVPRAVRPDLDNLEKAIMDAMKFVAWNDDAQVVAKSAQKCYGARADTPHVCVQIAHAHREAWPPLVLLNNPGEVLAW